jgi:hypothetical protein
MRSRGGWNWRKDAGAGLIASTTIMMCLPIYAGVSAPDILLRDWWFFLPFVVLPYGLGIALWISGSRSAGRS